MNRLRIRLLNVTLIAFFFIQITIGYRILDQAWSRDNAPAEVTLKSHSQIRETVGDQLVFNDSQDGSAWAYGAAGVNMVSAIDRGTSLIWDLARNDLFFSENQNLTCSLMLQEGIYVLSSQTRLNLNDLPSGFLEIQGPPVSGSLNLYLIDYQSLFNCASQNGLDISAQTKPKWWDILSPEEIVRCYKVDNVQLDLEMINLWATTQSQIRITATLNEDNGSNNFIERLIE